MSNNKVKRSINATDERLLIGSSSASSCSSSESDEEEPSQERVLIEQHCKRRKRKHYTSASSSGSKFKYLFNSCTNRRHHCIHRSVRRLLRIMLCLLLLPLLLVVLYMPIYSSVQTRQVSLSDWAYNTSRNIADYVLPDNDTTMLEPRHICQNESEKIFLLIIICSSMSNFAARQTIRETWANLTEFNYDIFTQMHAHLKDTYLEPNSERLQYYSEFLKNQTHKTTTLNTLNVEPVVRIVFLLGRSKYESYLGNETTARIRSESEQYNDIIQENFIDTYNNLTIKSVLALKWVTRRCLQHAAYFMKCDDDTFVNIPNLLHFLLGGTVPLYNDTIEFHDRISYHTLAPTNRLKTKHNYLTGHLFCTARPIANVSSKWYIPYYMYPDDKYPKYLSGAGYLMSIDVVPRLYEAALNTSLIFLEDVYLTGMCAVKAHLERRHQPLFSYTRAAELCSFKGTITQHEIKDDSMLEAYTFVANISNRCAAPEKYFKRSRLNKHSNCV